MSVTTKRGDTGFTDLAGGRVPKNDPRIEALGVLDELDAFLADARSALEGAVDGAEGTGGAKVGNDDAESEKNEKTAILDAVRRELFQISALLAAKDPRKSASQIKGSLERVEGWAAGLEKKYPMRGFFYRWTKPGAIKLNIARTVCRRAERRLYPPSEEEPAPEGRGASGHPVRSGHPAAFGIGPFINRLSDLLFLLALAEERSGRQESAPAT
jgi:cob(I)alamin adenosyltransferase